jgi:RNA polymerase sigma-70 factor (ECF subfamily)
MQHLFNLDDTLAGERARLVRLCVRLSGDRDAAEDLAQETLIEAWRHQDRLHDQQGADRWLAAIARNVCLRWARQRGRERMRLSFPGYETPSEQLESLPAEDVDITVELEREELAELLDRALALLPADTRRVLVEKYIEETPLAEIAARLNLSAGAAAVRLHRGRLALHRVLTTDLRHELAPYGLVAPTDDTWQPTRMWCPLCGSRRLLGRLDPGTGELALRCTNCLLTPDAYIAYSGPCEPLRGLKSYRPALSRLMALMDDYYRLKLVNLTVPCVNCGQPTPLRAGAPADCPPLPPQLDVVHIRCAACGALATTARAAMALCMPQGREFWRRHPKIRLHSSPTVEAKGHAAVVSSLESLSDSARLDVITDRETYEVIAIHELP